MTPSWSPQRGRRPRRRPRRHRHRPHPPGAHRPPSAPPATNRYQPAYISLDAAARAAGTASPPINGLYLGVDQASQAEVRTALYDIPGVESVKLRSEQRSDLRSLLAIFTAVVAIMLAFAVAMAFALVFNAMTINVLERERSTGPCVPLGAWPGVIARLLLVEATTLWAQPWCPASCSARGLPSGSAKPSPLACSSSPSRSTRTSYLTTVLGILAVIVWRCCSPSGASGASISPPPRRRSPDGPNPTD